MMMLCRYPQTAVQKAVISNNSLKPCNKCGTHGINSTTVTQFLIFLVGLGRAEFVNKVVSFDDHIKTEHNLWHYLYFIVLLRLKKRTDFTGPQSYVHELIKVNIYTNELLMFLKFGLVTSGRKLNCNVCFSYSLIRVICFEYFFHSNET